MKAKENTCQLLSPKMRAKIFGLIGILQEKGNMLGVPQGELQLAKDRRKDFIERMMKDENV